MSVIILGIESSCDDTSAAILRDTTMLSNIIANQSVHTEFGGVVPELASRAHQQNIIPVVEMAIKKAGFKKEDINAVAFTRGPGLLGSLLVGTSFAKTFTYAMNVPLIEVNHLEAHILAHFIQNKENSNKTPEFPFLCLTVSGGHTQIVQVNSPFDIKIIGQTIDDAAGEAFDKAAKIMNLPYPGGPLIDKLAKEGDATKFTFNKPNVKDYDYSFSGLKTSILYFLRDQTKINPDFIEQNKVDLCASIQKTIIDILLKKLIKAVKDLNINQVAISGGVSANSGLRNALIEEGKKRNWNVFIPTFEFCTDNAAMIAVSGYYKYLNKDFAGLDIAPLARYSNK